MNHQILGNRFIVRCAAFALTAAFAMAGTPALADSATYQKGTKAIVGPLATPEPSEPSRPANPQPVCPQPSQVPVMPPYVTQPPNVQQALYLYVNNKYIDVPLYFQGKTLLLPLRVVSQKGGWSYSYRKGTATMERGDDVVMITVGNKSYRKNGTRHSLSGYAELIDGALYAPWQLVSNALGMRVKIGDTSVSVSGSSSKTRTYSLKVNGSKSPYAPYYSGKTLMLPLRFTTEILGYTYRTDAKNRCSIFNAKYVDTYVYWDLNSYPVDNRYVSLERAPELKDGVLYVPSSFMEDALKCTVKVSGTQVTVKR